MEIKVSIGEIVDKLTILTIKKNMITDVDKLVNINNEYSYLKDKIKHLVSDNENLMGELLDINSKLWVVEDKLRECERNKYFGEDFVALARSVYQLNDTRSVIKKQINIKYNSDFTEEKSYKKY